MAITLAEPIPETRRITPTDAYNFELVEDYVVQTDAAPKDFNVDPLFFIGDPLFPAIGSSHDDQPALKFRTFASAEQTSSSRQWLFRGMKWSTWYRDAAQNFQQELYNDTLPTVADRSWTFQPQQLVMDYARVADPTGGSKFTRPVPTADFSANPEPVAVKETGEPILGLSRTIYVPICTYVRNELTPPATLVTAPLVGIVNSDVVTIDGLTCAIGTVMIQNIGISNSKTSIKSDKTRVNFRTLTYTLAVKHDGWDIEGLNAGYYAIVTEGATSSVARILVKDGLNADESKRPMRPTSTKQLIDINGKWIDTSPDDPANANWRDDIHYRVFQGAIRAPFASFNFS